MWRFFSIADLFFPRDVFAFFLSTASDSVYRSEPISIIDSWNFVIHDTMK